MEKDIAVTMKMFWISYFSGHPKKSKRKKTSDKQPIVHEDDAALLDPGSNAFISTTHIFVKNCSLTFKVIFEIYAIKLDIVILCLALKECKCNYRGQVKKTW